MESITFELACATGDPLDRTLSILCKDGNGLVAHRAWRIADPIPISTLCVSMERIVQAWSKPGLWGDEMFFDVLDDVQGVIATPF